MGWDPTAANCSSFLNTAASSAHETGLFPRILSDGLSLAQWDISIKNWLSIKEWFKSLRQPLSVFIPCTQPHTLGGYFVGARPVKPLLNIYFCNFFLKNIIWDIFKELKVYTVAYCNMNLLLR